jgi:hypothetical protein
LKKAENNQPHGFFNIFFYVGGAVKHFRSPAFRKIINEMEPEKSFASFLMALASF